MIKNVILLFCFLAGATFLFLLYDADETQGDVADVLGKRMRGQHPEQEPSTKDSSSPEKMNKSTVFYSDDDSQATAIVNVLNASATASNRSQVSPNDGSLLGVLGLKDELLLNGADFLPSFNKSDPLPLWSKLPRTRFTDHVVELVTSLNLDAIEEKCPLKYKLIVRSNNNSVPKVQCDENQGGDWVWCQTLQRAFKTKPLPYSIPIGFILNDFFSPEKYDNACIGSSSAGGTFCMPNMEEIQKMAYSDPFKEKRSHMYRHEFREDVPWEDRDPKPVFRGTAWPNSLQGTACDGAGKNLTYQDFMKYYPARFRAVDFSVDHPDLLNARFSRIDWTLDGCMALNATNGLSKLLPVAYIENKDYFAKYQVALVLKGIGAAFRITIHLMTRTALVLQEIDGYQEWFTRYLQPYVHYIPLSANLDDLKEVMEWVRDHPRKVEAIAANGRAFYERYLSFFKSDEHVYEMVYRLSEYKQYIDSQIAQEGNISMAENAGIIDNPAADKVEQVARNDNLPIFNPKEPLPKWSTTLPRTRFTDHVLEVVEQLQSETNACPEHYQLIVNTTSTIPSVVCNPNSALDFIWCGTLQRIFASRRLAYNVSIGFVLMYSFNPSDVADSCLGSSSRGGKLCMPNMEQLQRMSLMAPYIESEPTKYRYNYRDDIPWEKRIAIPIYQGVALNRKNASCAEDVDEGFTYQDFLDAYPASFRAVDFSMDHSDLVKARFASIDRHASICFASNETNGLSKLLPIDAIPNQNYFENYQVALVLQADGVNFRLQIHMMTRTAIILQDSEVEEWFTQFLKPHVHFIPLASDLSNLNETLHWVKTHPKEVKEIGENGRTFYEHYLTFSKNDDHIYELVYRLSEYRHHYEIHK